MNNKYRIEICKTEHFYTLNPREYDRKTLFSMPNFEQLINHYCRSSCAFTGFYGDDIIGMGGIFPLWPGVGEAWMFVGPELAKHKRFVFTQVSKYLLQAISSLGLHRVQMVCLNELEVAHRFAEHLGFTPEGSLRSYDSQKNNYTLYSRINDG